MRPLKAIIIAANKKTGLKIRIESGLIANLPYNKKYYAGEKIIISYDFTKNKVGHILKDVIEEMGEIDTIEKSTQKLLE